MFTLNVYATSALGELMILIRVRKLELFYLFLEKIGYYSATLSDILVAKKDGTKGVPIKAR
jgi:hypothetical protein